EHRNIHDRGEEGGRQCAECYLLYQRQPVPASQYQRSGWRAGSRRRKGDDQHQHRHDPGERGQHPTAPARPVGKCDDTQERRRLWPNAQLTVQAVAERFLFPWSFLFDGDDPDNPNLKDFWGFKHIIEYMPEFSISTPVNFNPAINVTDTLDIAFVCNNGIDTQ